MATVVLTLACVLGGQTLAAPKVQVIGLFKDRALVRIDGTQRLLKLGQTSPEGVRLIAADSRAATLEVEGRRIEFGLDRGMGGRYGEPENAETRIYRDARGMFSTVGSINGRTVNFLVDTGATQVAMSSLEARRLGVEYRVSGERGLVSTASGVAQAYRVKLDSVKVGGVELRNVDALVLAGDSPQEVLLGMSFLSRLEMENSGNMLLLRRKF